jgi:hypothetical protein
MDLSNPQNAQIIFLLDPFYMNTVGALVVEEAASGTGFIASRPVRH